MLYIASDHGGFKRKEYLKCFLTKRGIIFFDMGPERLNPTDDYPDYAEALARKVSDTGARGVLLCANAIGVCVVANKVRGIRAGIGYSTYAARTMRNDDDTNILCLPGLALTNSEIERILDMWLKTKFSGIERYKRRIRKIHQLEQRT